jgi:DNA polymerase delta subunit 2
MEARLQLVFPDKSSINSLPTGLVAAVLGRVNEHGFFDVRDICLPGCLKPGRIPSGNDDPEYVAFISGLQLGSPNANAFSMQLLRDFLMGLSMDEEDRKLSACITRVILAGDTVFMSTEKDPTASSLADADVFLSEIASVVPVDVMSGPRDPVNYCLPQQPLHSGLFSEARRYRNLNVRTNPYKFRLGETVCLGTSGQNILDIMEFTSIKSPLDALELVAESRYLAPTAPDTLGCYPFTSKDPLVIENDAPAIMFAGNQVGTSTSLTAEGAVRLACIADFTLSPCVLLVNVNNLNDVRTVEFKAPSSSV